MTDQTTLSPVLPETRSPGTVKFITLGCKVNQYETQGMRESLLRGGLVEVRDKKEACQFVVINTCTVTSEADRENRYWIRRARREHPDAKIVVTGCYVERNRTDLSAMEEPDLILANHEKSEIANHLFEGCATPEVQSLGEIRQRKQEFTPLSISGFSGHARAFVKIQDGCNHACSFCKVVMVRGRSRSRDADGILDEIRRLRDGGYREVVFAGIQLGAYGEEWGKPGALIDVLEQASRVEGIERLRLSSIEPTDVNPELIGALRDIPKCCPHLHIPLQSGDDEVLQRMNRRYWRDYYRDLIATLKAELPGFMLTADVMAGFAGETEDEFRQTVELLEQVVPLRCHVFPYSAREGTRAHRLVSLPPQVVRDRVATLMRLSDRLGGLIRQAWVGKTVPVLVEKKLLRGGLVQGLTPNYLKVCFQGQEKSVGQIVPVQLLTVQGEVFLGAAVNGSVRGVQAGGVENAGFDF